MGVLDKYDGYQVSFQIDGVSANTRTVYSVDTLREDIETIEELGVEEIKIIGKERGIHGSTNSFDLEELREPEL